jgi:hypothetical protein
VPGRGLDGGVFLISQDEPDPVPARGRLAAPAASLLSVPIDGHAPQYDSVSFPAAPFFPLPNPFRQVNNRRPAGCPCRPVYVLTAPGQYLRALYPTSCFPALPALWGMPGMVRAHARAIARG